jgi:hypothetical protein
MSGMILPIKLTWLAGLLTFVCLFFAPALVQAQDNQIVPGLCSGANLEFTQNPTTADCNNGGEDATTKINRLVKQVINILSAVVGIVAVVMIIFGGLRYITSGGNDANVTSAKNTILYAVIGLIIVALAQIIVRFTLSKLANA